MLRGITISPSTWPGLAVKTKGRMEPVLAGARVELTKTAGDLGVLDTTGAGVENTNIGLGLVLLGAGPLPASLSCPEEAGGGFFGLGGLAPLTTLTGLGLLPSEESLKSSKPGTLGGLL